MSSGNLAKRLQREIKASPQKAAVLGVLALVALYFWAPLLLGWVSGGKSPAAAVALQDPASAAQPLTIATSDDTGASVGPTWQEIDAWIERDLMMKPAAADLLAHNPFHVQTDIVQTDELAAVEAAPDEAGQQQQSVTPVEAGLVLTSTITGGKRPVALINGRAYARGSTIRGEGEFGSTTFTLVEVRSKSVVLRQGDKTYEVKISPTELALSAAD